MAAAPELDAPAADRATETRSSWTFLTNHTHVLVCLSEQPELRGWEIARMVGITERATQKIIADLVAEGYVTRERIGRRNRYTVNRDLRLRHPLEAGHLVGELLDAVRGGVRRD